MKLLKHYRFGFDIWGLAETRFKNKFYFEYIQKWNKW